MRDIEPGLLQLFQIFGGIQWVLMLLMYSSAAPGDDPGTYAQAVFGLAHATLMLVYLFWWQLRQWLGRYFLPLAIFLSVGGLILGRALGVAVRLQVGITGEAAANDPGALLLWLFVPLVVVSTQYGWRAMLGFSLSTTALELVLAFTLMQLGGPDWESIIEDEMLRLTVYIIIGYVFARLIAAQRAQKQELAAANAQLARHATTLEQLAVSRERNRMARELHDTLAHTLSAVSLQLEAISTIWDSDPEMARQTLERTHHETREGLQQTRLALQALRTDPVEDMGLGLALQNLAQTAVERAQLRLRLDIPDQLDEYPAEIEQNLYRITEEALNNIVKHANATTAAVILTPKSDVLTLTIADDGIGFDPAAQVPNGHYGLVGMRERAALCGGKLQIESKPEQGTVVRLHIQGLP